MPIFYLAMNHIFRLPPSSVFTCYAFSRKYYDGNYVCSHCSRRYTILERNRKEYSTFKPAIFNKLLKNKKSTSYTKKIKTELLKVTNTQTTQTTMPIGKLNASHVTAFAEQPGMILKNLKNLKNENSKLHDSNKVSDPLPAKQSTKIVKSFSTSEKPEEINKSENSNSSSELEFEFDKRNVELYDFQLLSKNSLDKNVIYKKPNAKICCTEEYNDYVSNTKNIKALNKKLTKVKNLKEFEELTIKQMDLKSAKSQFVKSSDLKSIKPIIKLPEDRVVKELLKEKIRNLKNNSLNNSEKIYKEDYNIKKLDISTQTENESSDLETQFNIKNTQLTENCKNYNKLLLSYVDVCINCDLLEYAYSQLKNSKSQNKIIKFPEIYNTVLEGFSVNGNWTMVQDVMKKMEKYNVPCDCQTYAVYLDCLARVPHSHVTETKKREITQKILNKLRSEGFRVNDLFLKTNLKSDQRENILKQIRIVLPQFEISSSSVNLNSICPLVDDLYKGNYIFKSPIFGYTREKMNKLVKEQLSLEQKMVCEIKAVVGTGSSVLAPSYRQIWLKLTEIWKETLRNNFVQHLKALKAESERQLNKISLYAYLNSLPVEKFVNVMLEEINQLTSISESFSATTSFQYRKMGDKIWYRYIVQKKMKSEEVANKIISVIEKYASWYIEPNGPARNTRQKWQMLLEDCPDINILNTENIMWPSDVRRSIGKFLYNIIFKSTLIPPNLTSKGTKKQNFPAFYLVLRYKSGKLTEEIKCHPVVSRLYRRANINTLIFDVDQLPMVCPPKPWCSINSGGYLILPTKYIRDPGIVTKTTDLRDVPSQQMYPIFDSLNQLQSIPWTVNEDVLDVALDVFKNGGSVDLKVPEYPDYDKVPDPPKEGLGSKQRFEAFQERMNILKKRHDEYGLWCEALYKLSLANHFRNKVFWLPQNLDFRGRVYPVPPHVNHLSADLYRSLLLFAKKERLGEKGLDWLKIHTINLVGTHKRKSIKERLEFANEILPEILDSAENPMKGNKWWTKSENPWQTLAVCFEIKKALNCDVPENFKSSFPIHQDGSCNGLQHYAALGRDVFGASSVNLAPSDEPQDVYSVVTNIIEHARRKDAENGLEIAQVLEGYIRRKVVKQTVMTTVYGVTRYGARQQIAGQLKNIETFPENKVWEAANYLTAKIFGGLEQMFTSAKEIQDWFIKCADIVTHHYNESISWITPLGLPVTQPYYVKLGNEINSIVPNKRKQRNAFPPNFIHSLDSSHMMLTSLFCEQAGITFASIHDCFWTHACSVDIMNRICREKFIALHSQEILNDLSKYFIRHYKYKSMTVDEVKNAVFSKVPETGNFDLNSVMNSVYFFS